MITMCEKGSAFALSLHPLRTCDKSTGLETADSVLTVLPLGLLGPS